MESTLHLCENLLRVVNSVTYDYNLDKLMSLETVMNVTVREVIDCLVRKLLEGNIEDLYVAVKICPVVIAGLVLVTPSTLSMSLVLTALTCDPHVLKCIEEINQSNDIYRLAAVGLAGDVIKYITKPSIGVKLVAIKQNPMCLEYIGEQEHEVQKLAVSINPHAIQWAKSPRDDVSFLALELDGMTLKYQSIVQCREKCLVAVSQNGMAIEYAEYIDDEIMLAAVTNCGLALQFIFHFAPDDVRKAAVTEDGFALQFLATPSDEEQELAIRQNAFALQFIEDQSEKICNLAMELQPLSYRYIHNPTDYHRAKVEEVKDHPYLTVPLEMLKWDEEVETSV